ncbi:sensor histidine kinase [Deferribacter autotrophicus]|nr:ATP-binding protein [Deferribacter autotrophicus]
MFITFIIFLFYGLSFFILGFAILLKDKRFSRLKIANHLNYIAFFGILHGIHEWIDLYILMEKNCIKLESLINWYQIKFFILLLSFLFLLYFGISTISILAKLEVSKIYRYLFLAIGFGLSLVIYYNSIKMKNDILIRYVFGFSSAVISGVSFLIIYAKFRSKHIFGYKNLMFCGYSFIGYGIFSGLFPSNFHFGIVYVAMIRGIFAILIFIFLFKFLKVFDDEYIQHIEDNLRSLALNDRLSSIGRLAMGIAHEINTPLTNATMIVEILKSKFNVQDKKILEKLDSLEKNIDRASTIAKELLLFSKDEKIQSFEKINIKDIMENVKFFIKNHEKFKFVVFNVDKNCYFEGIAHKIEEVLINLIMNAFDAVAENPKIEVSAHCSDKNIILSVSDNGEGVDPEILDKIFDPFFTTKKPNYGTGMGLYLCYNIVKMHKGEILVESELGKGTTFKIILPRYQNEMLNFNSG